MAEPKFTTPNYLKRSVADPNLDYSTSKRRRILHHHRIHHKQAIHVEAAVTPPDAEIIHYLLTRSLGLALQNAGFDAADPVAIESFRSKVEKYIFQFLSAVTQSMLCCRRSQPTPQDFIHALTTRKLTLNSLEPQLRTNIPLQVSQPPLPTPPPEEVSEPQLSTLLGAELSGLTDKKKRRYIPIQLPLFPSKHTYMNTPDWTQREKDPRKIREKATEEGRLGEEALRRLAGAVTASSTRKVPGAAEGGKRGQRRREREEMWESLLEAVTAPPAKPQMSNGDMDLDVDDHDSNSIRGVNGGVKARISKADLRILVNCERPYWRKEAKSESKKARQKSSSIVGSDPPIAEKEVGAVLDRS